MPDAQRPLVPAMAPRGATFVTAAPVLPSLCHVAGPTAGARDARPAPRRRPIVVAAVVVAPRARAAVAGPAESAVGEGGGSTAPRYACPTCRMPVRPLEEPRCPSCATAFAVGDGFLNMVPKDDRADGRALLIPLPLRPFFAPSKQSIFQSPVVSFLYERGWRGSFERRGFPGPDAEYALLEAFFLGANGGDGENQSGPSEKPPASAAVTVDLSCGSGLLTRRMAAAGRLGRVVAVDLSAEMLRETLRRAEDAGVPPFDAVRADVARLPFESGSVDYVHAGAALHCWPRPQDGLAEVHRVLRPRGRFFATTFLKNTTFFAPAALDSPTAGPRATPFRFFEVDELRRLFQAAGFVNVDVEVADRCLIVRCEKKHS